MEPNISDKEIAENKLRTFMNISHEIRTPLTLIITPLLQLLKEDGDPHRRTIYKTMRRNAERILNLLNQMTDVDLIEQGMLRMHMCETDLVGYLEDIHQMFHDQAIAKMIIFDFHHDNNHLPVWIDRLHFDKVIINILSNAFRFTPVGGFITMRLESDGHRAIIYIRDTGIGIPKDKLPYIFDRFFLAHLSMEERNIGAGIGLDLSKMLVDLHHGTISVHNNTEGGGCEFQITIPLGCQHLSEEEMLLEKDNVTHYNTVIEEGPVEQPGNVDLTPRQRQRIVVVEDTADVRDFLISELQDDYEVISCVNGREGLTAISMTNPDLVVSDVDMPEMDGRMLCAHVKANSATSHIPFILLTTTTLDEDRLDNLEAGADAFIVKPFNMDILRRAIVNLLHRNRMLKLKFARNDQLEEMIEAPQIQSPDDRLLERVMSVVNKNIANSDLSIDMIADEVGISRVHLHRKMKDLTGQTPHDFIRTIRLKHAAQLLAAGDKSVTDIVYACGFSSAASFSTLFKKVYGVSPREYSVKKV